MKNLAKLALPLAICFSNSLFAGQVNINAASADTIAAELNGIGVAKAQAIVDYRNTHGPFKSADELASVKGVGEKIVERNRENILISSQ